MVMRISDTQDGSMCTPHRASATFLDMVKSFLGFSGPFVIVAIPRPTARRSVEYLLTMRRYAVAGKPHTVLSTPFVTTVSFVMDLFILVMLLREYFAGHGGRSKSGSRLKMRL